MAQAPAAIVKIPTVSPQLVPDRLAAVDPLYWLMHASRVHPDDSSKFTGQKCSSSHCLHSAYSSPTAMSYVS